MIRANIHLGRLQVSRDTSQELRLVGHAPIPGDRRLAVHHVDEAEDVTLGAESSPCLADERFDVRPPRRRNDEPRKLAEDVAVGIDQNQPYLTSHGRVSGLSVLAGNVRPSTWGPSA